MYLKPYVVAKSPCSGIVKMRTAKPVVRRYIRRCNGAAARVARALRRLRLRAA
jgi:hypothetical protein